MIIMGTTILRYAKAVVGGLAAGVAALTPALADGTVSAGEWVTIAIAVLGGAGLIAVVPNKAAAPPVVPYTPVIPPPAGPPTVS
jgi:hypothetical protein